MTECSLMPPLPTANLSPLTSTISPLESHVRTVSSTVPIKYERRVRFSDLDKQYSASSDCLVSDPVDKAEMAMAGDSKGPIGATHKPRPLAQIEPLAVATLRQTRACFQDSNEQIGKSQALVAAYPRIEILLCRPKSLNNVCCDVDNIKKDFDLKSLDSASASPPIKRANRWHFAKKLTRFASSPSLFSSGNDKVEMDVVGPLSRTRCDSNATISSESPPETQKSASDFFNRLKGRKSKNSLMAKGRIKPIHIEVFNNYDGKNENAKDINTQDSKTVDLDNMEANDVTDSTMHSTHVHEQPGSDVPIADSRSDNNPPLHVLLNSTNSIPSDNGIKAHLMHHFKSELPYNGSSKTHAIIKDATNVQPLRDGDVLITDILANKMVLFDTHGMPKVAFTLDEASEPWAACMTSDGTLAVTLRRQGCVSLWSLSGLPLSEFGQGILVAPTGIQVDSLDRFAVTDEKSNTVSIFNRQGQFVLTFVMPQLHVPASPSPTSPVHFNFNQPRYVCVSNDGYYVICDSANHCLQVFDSNGNFSHRIGSFGQKDGQFRFPYGVACDNTGTIYVADHFNHRVSVFSFEGVFQHHALTSGDGITRPKGLAIHNSHLYVTYGQLRAGKISVFNISSRQLTFATNTSTTSP